MVSTALINPNNTKAVDHYFPKEVYDRVPGALRIIACIWTGLVIIGIVCLSKPKKAYQKLKDDHHGSLIQNDHEEGAHINRTPAERANRQSAASHGELDLKTCLKTPQFVLL